MKSSKAATTVIKSKSGAYAVGIVGVIGVLYLMSRETSTGESISETIIEKITDTTSEIINNTAGAAGQIIGETAEKTIQTSEESTSKKVFGGGSVGGQTYPEFMKDKSIITKGSAAAGNIISWDYAGKYGAYAAEETKKYAPGTKGKLTQYKPTQQAFIATGQALTVPFGQGGAAGAGYRFGETFKKVAPKTAGWVGSWF